MLLNQKKIFLYTLLLLCCLYMRCRGNDLCIEFKDIECTRVNNKSRCCLSKTTARYLIQNKVEKESITELSVTLLKKLLLEDKLLTPELDRKLIKHKLRYEEHDYINNYEFILSEYEKNPFIYHKNPNALKFKFISSELGGLSKVIYNVVKPERALAYASTARQNSTVNEMLDKAVTRFLKTSYWTSPRVHFDLFSVNWGNWKSLILEQVRNEDPLFDNKFFNYNPYNGLDEWGAKKSSYIPLPKYFHLSSNSEKEFKYFDQLYILRGHLHLGGYDLSLKLLQNCAYLIQKYGYVPYKNRYYALDRSGPPYMAFIVKHIIDELRENYRWEISRIVRASLPAVFKELFGFWFNPKSGRQIDIENGTAENPLGIPLEKASIGYLIRRAREGKILFRYYSHSNKPRSENYLEDIHLAKELETNNLIKEYDINEIYRNLRAADESGWGPFIRWHKVLFSGKRVHIEHNTDALMKASLITTHIAPAELNAYIIKSIILANEMLQLLEENSERTQLSEILDDIQRNTLKTFKEKLIDNRYITDYDFVEKKKSKIYTAPLYIAESVLKPYLNISLLQRGKGHYGLFDTETPFPNFLNSEHYPKAFVQEVTEKMRSWYRPYVSSITYMNQFSDQMNYWSPQRNSAHLYGYPTGCKSAFFHAYIVEYNATKTFSSKIVARSQPEKRHTLGDSAIGISSALELIGRIGLQHTIEYKLKAGERLPCYNDTPQTTILDYDNPTNL